MLGVQVCWQKIVQTAHERCPDSPRGLAKLLSSVAILQETHAEDVIHELMQMMLATKSFRDGFKPGASVPSRINLGLLRVTDKNDSQVRAIVVTNHKFTTESLLTLIAQTPDDLPVTRHSYVDP